MLTLKILFPLHDHPIETALLRKTTEDRFTG